MKRSDLVNVFKNNASSIGYNFYTGIEADIPFSAKLPAVWLIHPALKSSDGIRERKDSYEFKFLIIHNPIPRHNNEAVCTVMEQNADFLLNTLLDCPFVRKINKIKTKINTKPFTINGDISLSVEADIQLSYYNY